MANKAREQLWQERVAQLQVSGMSQRAYAVEHGFSVRQVGYWARRMTKSPAHRARAAAGAGSAIRSPSGGRDEHAQRARLDIDFA